MCLRKRCEECAQLCKQNSERRPRLEHPAYKQTQTASWGRRGKNVCMLLHLLPFSMHADVHICAAIANMFLEWDMYAWMCSGISLGKSCGQCKNESVVEDLEAVPCLAYPKSLSNSARVFKAVLLQTPPETTKIVWQKEFLGSVLGSGLPWVAHLFCLWRTVSDINKWLKSASVASRRAQVICSQHQKQDSGAFVGRCPFTPFSKKTSQRGRSSASAHPAGCQKSFGRTDV